MTVGELIEELKKYDENIYVHLYHAKHAWYYDTLSKDEIKIQEIDTDFYDKTDKILIIGG